MFLVRGAGCCADKGYNVSAGRTNIHMDEEQEKVLVEKLTEGRGGAFFYFSQDKCVSFSLPDFSFFLIMVWFCLFHVCKLRCILNLG